MKKILISAAVITGLIAPAIYAAAQYTTAIKSTQTTSIVWTGSGKSQNTTTHTCLKNALSKYTWAKKQASGSYREKLAYIRQKTWGKVASWEKIIAADSLKKVQKEYIEKLVGIKHWYQQDMRNCTKN